LNFKILFAGVNSTNLAQFLEEITKLADLFWPEEEF
jgi:hypothetical protein